MDMSTIIHASITLLAMGLLFYYFKNRISITEQKVNLMFQLIQEHEKQSSMQVMHPEQMFKQVSTNMDVDDNGLIHVSDDETSSSLSTVVNDLLNPKMESSKVSSVINNTLRIPDELNPDAASVSNSIDNGSNEDTSSKTTEVHIEIAGTDTKKSDKDDSK